MKATNHLEESILSVWVYVIKQFIGVGFKNSSIIALTSTIISGVVKDFQLWILQEKLQNTRHGMIYLLISLLKALFGRHWTWPYVGNSNVLFGGLTSPLFSTHEDSSPSGGFLPGCGPLVCWPLSTWQHHKDHLWRGPWVPNPHLPISPFNCRWLP